jgi:hypothetical protein
MIGKPPAIFQRIELSRKPSTARPASRSICAPL